MLNCKQIDLQGNDQLIRRSSNAPESLSFKIKIVIKQGLNFEAQPSLKYLCHVRNSRLILETVERSPKPEASRYLKVLNFLLNGVSLSKVLDSPLTILHSQIQAVEVVDSASKSYVRLLLRTMTQNPTISATHEVIFEVCYATLRRSPTPVNWAEIFVSCINQKRKQ